MKRWKGKDDWIYWRGDLEEEKDWNVLDDQFGEICGYLI